MVIPLDTATRYVQPNTTAPLSLRAIWFYLPWVDEPYGKYVVASTKVGIARVSLAVAKDLLNWLRGVSATSDNLVPLSSGGTWTMSGRGVMMMVMMMVMMRRRRGAWAMFML